MPREIKLSAADLKALEQEVAKNRVKMPKDEATFVDFLIARAKSNQSPPNAPAPAAWTWTHKF